MSEMSDLFDSLDIGDLDEIAGKLNVAPKKAPEPQVVVEEVETPPLREKVDRNISDRKYVKLGGINLNEEVQKLFDESEIFPESVVAPKATPKKRKVTAKKNPTNNKLMEGASRAISHTMKNKPKYEAKPLREQQSVEERIKLLEQDVFRVQAQATPNTLVAGIGASLDSGGGSVNLWDLDDVNIGAPINGQYPTIGDGAPLVFDSTLNQWVAGAPGVGGVAGVERIIPGKGIDVNPPGGVGQVEIVLDANLSDLEDVTGTPTQNGDLVVWNGSSWQIGAINTAQLQLKTPQRNVFNVNRYSRSDIIATATYNTQEDANVLFVDLISDLDERITNLTPGEPGSPTANEIGNLDDVEVAGADDGDFLVYDDGTDKWNAATVKISKSEVGTSLPNSGDEKEGDIFYKEDDGDLYVYTTVWTKVSGSGGASVEISAAPPADPSLGDLWVETDNWTLLTYDGYNWVGLTNEGLINGMDPSTLVTNTDLDATIDSIEFQINQNALTDQASLLAAIQGLDATHLRMDPQGPLTGALILSDHDITSAKQATTKEFVDNNYLNIYPAKSLQNSLSFQKGDTKEGHQFKISVNGNLDYSTNIYSMRGGQMRFRTSHTGSEGDHVGSHIVLDSASGTPTTKIYHVSDPTSDTMAANKQYVDTQISAIPTPDGVPVGSIMMWINAVAPTGWFKLKGSNFDINQYPLLHAYLQQSDGYTSGKLPDWRGHYPGQLGDHLTGDVGSKHSQKTAKPSGGSPKSSHKFNDGHQDTANKAGGTHFADVPTANVVIDTGWDSVTRPKTVAVHFIIKHD